MSKMLIVDDEQMFLKILAEGLRNRKEMDGVEILTAYNGREAMNILRKVPEIDLVITDLRMPEVDGFQLISYMTKKHPNIPIIVMTAYGSQEMEKTVEEKGIFHYIEKPIDFDELIQKASSRIFAKQQGSLKGFKLSTLLQIIEMDKMSCSLHVSGGERNGILFIKDGQVVNARAGGREGEDAALDIITWEEVKIDIKDPDSKVKETMTRNLMNLLLEAFRRKDEQETFGGDRPALESDLFGKPGQKKTEIAQREYRAQKSHEVRKAKKERNGLKTQRKQKSQTQKKEEEMGKLEDVQKLQDSLAEELPQFKAVAVVSVEDGLPLAGVAADPSFDVGVPSGAFAEAFKSVAKAYGYSKWGGVNEFLFSGPDTIVLMVGLKGGKYYQGISVGAKATLGMVKAIYSKYKDKIETLL